MEGWGSRPGEPIPGRLWAAGLEAVWQCVGRRTPERGLMGGTMTCLPFSKSQTPAECLGICLLQETGKGDAEFSDARTLPSSALVYFRSRANRVGMIYRLCVQPPLSSPTLGWTSMSQRPLHFHHPVVPC